MNVRLESAGDVSSEADLWGGARGVKCPPLPLEPWGGENQEKAVIRKNKKKEEKVQKKKKIARRERKKGQKQYLACFKNNFCTPLNLFAPSQINFRPPLVNQCSLKLICTNSNPFSPPSNLFAPSQINLRPSIPIFAISNLFAPSKTNFCPLN